MTTAYAMALAEEVNGRLQPNDILQAIDFHADKTQVAGTTIKAFCPIHQDSRFRSLLIDEERGAFRCTIKTCAGYEGGSLLELYALSKNVPLSVAAYQLANALQMEIGDGWRNELAQSYLADAATCRDGGDYTQATSLLQELVQLMPEQVDARVALANMQAELGNEQAASEEYARLMDYLATNGRLDEADQVSEQALTLFPDNEDILFTRVKLAEDAGHHAHVIERMQHIIQKREAAGRDLDNVGLLEQLVLKAPYDPDPAIKLAGLYEQQHNMRGASRQYENAGRIYVASGQTPQAIEMLQKVVQFNSENVRARLELAKVLAESGDIDQAREHTFKVVNQQIDQQEFGTAVSTVNKWLEQEPDNIDARELLARIYLDQENAPTAATYLAEGAALATKAGNPNRAADLLLRAKFLTPDDVDLRRRLIASFLESGEVARAGFEIVDLAEILFSSEQSTDAVALLQDGLAKPLSLSLKLQMVNLLQYHGKEAEALAAAGALQQEFADAAETEEVAELYETLTRLEPASLDHHLQLFEVLWPTQPERAAEAAAASATRLLSLDMQPEAESLLEAVAGRIEGYLTAVPALLELCEQCARLDLAGAIYQVAIQGFAEQDPELALKAARRMATLDPTHDSAPSDIGFLLASLGRNEEAAAQYAHVSLLLRQAGDYEHALQFATEATALNPSSISALACQALASREVLEPEETAALAQQLLEATRAASEKAEVAAGYLAYTELYPDDDAALEEAEQRLHELTADEAVAIVLSRKASRFSATGDWEKAVDALDTAWRMAPTLPEIGEQLGEAARLVGRSEAASAAYAGAAAAFAHANDVESARRCTIQARDCNPEQEYSLYLLFTGAEAAGLPQIAAAAAAQLVDLTAKGESPAIPLRWSRDWVRLAPTDPAAHLALGAALSAADQSDSAAESLGEAARLYNENEEPDSAIAVLAKLDELGSLPPAALDLLRTLLDRDEATAESLNKGKLLLGRAVIEQGDVSTARALANELAASKLWQDAAGLYSLVAAREADHAHAAEDYFASANLERKADRPAAAVSCLKAAIAQDDSRADIQNELAALLDELGRHDEALPYHLAAIRRLSQEKSLALPDYLKQLRATFANSPDALVSIAKTLLAEEQTTAALDTLEKAAEHALASQDTASLLNICSLDENLTRSSTLLSAARADALMGMENEQQALEWVRTSGAEMLRAGKAGEALEMARRWMSLDAEDAGGLELAAAALEQLKQPAEAAAQRLKLAELHRARGNAPAALQQLEQARALMPASTELLQATAALQQEMGSPQQAAETYLQLGDALLETDGAQALAAYESALKLNEGNSLILRKVADATNDLRGFSAALPVYRRWIDARQNQPQPPDLATDLAELRKCAPDNIPLLQDLIAALLGSGRAADAAPHLNTIAELLEREGRYADAAAALEQALAHEATTARAEAHSRIAAAYEKAGLAAQAQEHLRAAANWMAGQGSIDAAPALWQKVLRLQGDSPLPEDLAQLARAYAATGDSAKATATIADAFRALNADSGNKERQASILEQALEIDPLNVDYLLAHMKLVPPSRALATGLKAFQQASAAAHYSDAVRIGEELNRLAPHDLSVRQMMFEPLRQTGNKSRLRQELHALAADALALGDDDAAHSALDEAEGLSDSAGQYRALAEANERARRTDHAARMYVRASMAYAKDGKAEQAIAALNRAVTMRPAAVSAEGMAMLVDLLGESVHDIAREQLRAALTARRQKQSQLIATALLKTSSAEKGADILKTVATLGGSTFAVSIVMQQVKELEAAHRMADAILLVNVLLKLVPDSPDAWHLGAQVYRTTDQPDDARRCALEAARLYQMAGAVIEEENSFHEALSAVPTDAGVKSEYADFLVRENRPDEAASVLMEIIADAETRQNQDALIEVLNRAVQIAPANTDLRQKLATTLEDIAPDSAIHHWLEAARAFRNTGEEEKANRIYSRVLQLHPLNEEALQESLVAAQKLGDKTRSASLAITLADVKVQRKNIGEAVRLLQAQLEIDPDNLDILERLSSLSGRSNNPEVFQATTRALAQRLFKIGDYNGALKQYEALIDRTPRDTRLLVMLLETCTAAGEQEKTRVYAQQLLTVAKETEDPERIRLAAMTILNFDEENTSARSDLGEALLSLNRVHEAVAEWLRAAELYEATGNTPAAYTTYRRVTQASPNTVQAWRRLSHLAMDIGDLETARMALLHVLDKSGDSVDEKLGPLLERLLEAMPDDLQIHKIAFDYYRKANQTDKAVTQCVWLARNFAAQGSTEQAETLLDEGAQWAPDNPQLKAARFDLIKSMGRMEELQLRFRKEAQEAEAKGNLDEAIQRLHDVVALMPGQVAIHKDLQRLYEKAGHSQEAFTQGLETLKLLLEKGELEEAREMAERLAASQPDDYTARERVADLLSESSSPDVAARHYCGAAALAVKAEQVDRAIALLAKAITARPTWAEARRQLAQVCEDAGRADQAFDAWIGLVAILLDSGDYAQATETLSRLATQQPGSHKVREQLANLYERTGNRDKQVATLKELADIYSQAGEAEQTLEIYRKLVSLLPDDADLLTAYVELLAQTGASTNDIAIEYTRLADVLARRGDYEAAFQTYEQVIGLAPENTAARSRYATFLLNRGSRNRALTEMRQLARQYQEREEFSAAVEVLNAALAISPRDADLCLELAKAQEAAGMHEDARVSYARATAILASTAAVKGIDTYRRILSQDENNTAVRLRLVELLMNSGDKMEAAREARILAEIHIARGELGDAENAYRLVDACEPESLDEVRQAISRDSYDPSLQYVHYVRLGNRLVETGDVDAALDAYRTARSLHDDQPDLIQKCIDCVSLVAPEAEAIPDYLLMAEKLLMAGDYSGARQAYERVRLLDPFNNDAKCGLETVNSAERSHYSRQPAHDDLVLKTSRGVSKRVALLDLLMACQEAALDSSDDARLGGNPASK